MTRGGQQRGGRTTMRVQTMRWSSSSSIW
jgi:hypothetical protein